MVNYMIARIECQEFLVLYFTAIIPITMVRPLDFSFTCRASLHHPDTLKREVTLCTHHQ